MYPADTDARIQRPTVPECDACKVIWADSETQFRNMMVIAGQPNKSSRELWDDEMKRSFDKASGNRWLLDLVAQLVPVQSASTMCYAVYPQRDDRVMCVVRRMIRGLCHYHKLGSAIADKRVHAQVMTIPIPPAFREQMVKKSLGDTFCQYSYFHFNGADEHFPECHSTWLIRFYERTEFLGLISMSEDGWVSQTGS